LWYIQEEAPDRMCWRIYFQEAMDLTQDGLQNDDDDDDDDDDSPDIRLLDSELGGTLVL